MSKQYDARLEDGPFDGDKGTLTHLPAFLWVINCPMTGEDCERCGKPHWYDVEDFARSHHEGDGDVELYERDRKRGKRTIYKWRAVMPTAPSHVEKALATLRMPVTACAMVDAGHRTSPHGDPVVASASGRALCAAGGRWRRDPWHG